VSVWLAQLVITSQRGSAWPCYIGHALSMGKMRFSTSRCGKINEYFVTKLGRRDYVGEIYKLIKFGENRLRNGASTWKVKYNGFVTFFVHLFMFFFRFLGQPRGRNFGPNCTLNGSKVVFRLIHVPFGVWCLQIYYEGVCGPKNRQILTHKSLDFLQKSLQH